MGLLSLLFGGGHSTPQTPPPPGHTWTYDPQGNLVPVPVDPTQQASAPPSASAPQAPMQAPQGAPMPSPALSDPNALAQAPAASQGVAPAQAPDAPEGAPIGVTALRPDNWQPHHAGILGQISDYILGTHFGRENERRNLSSAMQNMQIDPDQAIRRVMKVDPELAMKLEGQESEDKRAAAVNARELDYDQYRKENVTQQQVQNMLATAHDPKTYAAAINAGKAMYAQRGLSWNSTLFPDEYDPDNTNTVASGGDKVTAQRNRTVTQEWHGTVAGERDRAETARERYQSGQLGLGAARVGVARQNAKTAQGNLGERIQNDHVTQGQRQQTIDMRPDKGSVTVKMTPHGPLLVSPDGKSANLHVHLPGDPHNGKIVKYVNGGSLPGGRINWVPTGEIIDPAAPKSK